MHLAAAVPTKPGSIGPRPCVVLAGGRESSTWEHYPTHRWLGNQGTMPCCTPAACWKSRCTPVGDGDEKDLAENLCRSYNRYAVPPDAEINGKQLQEVRIPTCLDNIGADDIMREIEAYYRGGILRWQA